MAKGLELTDLQNFVAARTNEDLTPMHDWPHVDLACAIAGEAGETCNLVVKKYRRGFDGISEQRIGEELADVIIYVAMLAQKLDLNLAEAVVSKFNADSEKRGSKWRL